VIPGVNQILTTTLSQKYCHKISAEMVIYTILAPFYGHYLLLDPGIQEYV